MKKYYMGYRYINILRVMLMLLLIVIIILRKYILYNYQMSKIISIFKENMIGKILWIMIVIAESVYILYVIIFIPLLYKIK